MGPGWRRRSSLCCVLLWAAGLARLDAFEHGQLQQLTGDCKAAFDALWGKYYAPGPLDSQINCTDVLTTALNDASGKKCPHTDDMITCFNVVPDAWVNLYKLCPVLFSLPPNCDGVSKCQRPWQPGGRWDLYSMQVGRPIASYQYGTGIVPNWGSDWKTHASATDDGRRRRAYRRSLLADFYGSSGGAGAGSNAGCFPDFYVAQDFSDWLNNLYIEPTFGPGQVNPIGIIFWVLHGIGILSLAAL